ncbi:MAG: DUF721 domain-containing protein [Treponema sp.]|nr:DUF721 domain-containing protein [Treponema sp.]
MKENEFVKMNDILDMCNAFSQSAQGQLPSAWKRVVSRIKSVNETSENDELSDKKFPLGERLASNTRVLDLKNGTLIVESDHSGWIQYIKLYEKFILKGLKMESPDLKINSIAFKLKGSQENQTRVYEDALKKAQAEMEERMAKNEEEMEKVMPQKPSDDAQKLPPELRAKFDSMMKSEN